MLTEKVMIAINAALDHIEAAGESGVVLIAWGGNVAAGSVPDMSAQEKLTEIVNAVGRAAEAEANMPANARDLDAWTDGSGGM